MAAEQEQSSKETPQEHSRIMPNLSGSEVPPTLSGERPEDEEYNKLAKEIFSSDHNNNTSGTGNDVATNDGAIIETLDTVFHNKPGTAEGHNISGSDRADYYESKSYGKTDAEEELAALNNQPQ